MGDEGDAGDGGRWKWQQRTTQTQLTTKGVKRRRKCEGEENAKVGVKVKQTKQSYREREECVKRWSRGEES